MIESSYWKEELSRIAKQISPVKSPKRWSDRLVCTTERDVIVGFFIVRKLIDLKKVSSKSMNKNNRIFSIKAIKNVNWMNRFNIDENYDFDSEKPLSISTNFLSNQFIHSYTSFIDRSKDRNWENFYVVSDFDKRKHIFRIPFSVIISIFKTVSGDYPYEISAVYDFVNQDYIVKTN